MGITANSNSIWERKKKISFLYHTHCSLPFKYSTSNFSIKLFESSSILKFYHLLNYYCLESFYFVEFHSNFFKFEKNCQIKSDKEKQFKFFRNFSIDIIMSKLKILQRNTLERNQPHLKRKLKFNKKVTFNNLYAYDEGVLT